MRLADYAGHIAFVIELSVAEYAGTELPDGAKAVELRSPIT